MTDWIEIGKRYVLSNGTITEPVERTSPLSVFSDTHPFCAKTNDQYRVILWDRNGVSLDNDDFNIMDGVDEMPTKGEARGNELHELDMSFLFDVKAEAAAARAKFTTNTDMVLAMAEEFGEAIKALMDQKQKNKVTSADIYRECVQAAAMALRVATEGDPNFPDYTCPEHEEGEVNA